MISLVFSSSHEIVPGTHQSIPPNTLDGADYMDGVRFLDGKCRFRVRCAALSNHYDQKMFRLKVTVKGLNIFSEEFKTLSKLARSSRPNKRIRLRSDEARCDESAHEDASNDGASDTMTTFFPHWMDEKDRDVFDDIPLQDLSEDFFPDVESSSSLPLDERTPTMTQLLHEVTSLRAQMQDMHNLLRVLVNKDGK